MGNACCVTKELVVSCKNEVGALARATMPLKQNNINIECLVCYQEGSNNAKLHFITNNNKKAKELLTNNKLNVTENEVVCWTTPNTPGTLSAATSALAEGKIDIQYCYTSAPQHSDAQCVVFCTNNNTKANEILGKCCGSGSGAKGGMKGTSCCG